MKRIKFEKIKKSDLNEFSALVREFFIEMSRYEDCKITRGDVMRTFREFSQKPDKGGIYIFKRNNIPVGYAILINYWCNGYGGNLVVIDEIFIRKEVRKQGIAKEFMEYLIKKYGKRCVAISLEVHPKNKNAQMVWKKLGMESEGYLFMIKKLKPAAQRRKRA